METAPRHLCMIYDGPPVQHLAGLAELASERLRSNFRCMYLHNPATVAAMRTQLEAAGVRVEREIEKGALILSSGRDQLQDDRFDLDRMLGSLAEAARQAIEDGYDGLWASGDMAWEFGDEKNYAKLLEYEHALDALFEREPALHGVCQYDIGALPSEVIQWGLMSHRALYVNGTQWRANPHYEPARLLECRHGGVPRSEIEEIVARCTAA